MSAAPKQLALDVDAQAEKEAEAARIEALGDAHAVLLERVFAACRKVLRDRQADPVADELEAMWANRGRPVTAQVLRSALADSRGNYFRVEWLFWFAEHSQELRELLLELAIGQGPKDPADELADLHEIIREEFPKQATKLIQKAKAPRAPRAGGRKR